MEEAAAEHHEICVYRGDSGSGTEMKVGVCDSGSFSHLSKSDGEWVVPLDKCEKVALLGTLKWNKFEDIFGFLPEEGTKAVVEVDVYIKHQEKQWSKLPILT